MSISHARLDRFISEYCNVSRRAVRLMLAQKRIKVDDKYISDIGLIIHKFSHIELDGKTIQKNEAYYYMLHKPVGVVCATKDSQHKTVLDLIEHPEKASFHIVGRLDLNTSGLVLLTNDSRWSERLMSPESKVAKHYEVTLENAIETEQTQQYIDAFSKGMYFDYEDITTLPATLTVIEPHKVEVMLHEGKYHQIKRMFGRFRNPVKALHRSAVGKLTLDDSLPLGEGRLLTEEEIVTIFD